MAGRVCSIGSGDCFAYLYSSSPIPEAPQQHPKKEASMPFSPMLYTCPCLGSQHCLWYTTLHTPASGILARVCGSYERMFETLQELEDCCCMLLTWLTQGHRQLWSTLNARQPKPSTKALLKHYNNDKHSNCSIQTGPYFVTLWSSPLPDSRAGPTSTCILCSLITLLDCFVSPQTCSLTSRVVLLFAHSEATPAIFSPSGVLLSGVPQ